MPRELITLQFGPYANHIGAHFWNFQDELFSAAFSTANGTGELDADVLYRCTEKGNGGGGAATYTPRALIFDARNSSGIAQASAAWIPDAPSGHEASTGEPLSRRPPPRQHAFQRYLRELESGAVVATAGGDLLEGSVSSWGDYLKALLHPQSLVALGTRNAVGEQLGTEAAGGISEDTPFDAFTMGSGLANEALLEPFRRLLEECDRPQGVQAVVDIDSGWGGLAEDVLTAVREEMPRAALLVLGSVPPVLQHGAGVGPLEQQTAGGPGSIFDYASRNKAGVRAVNMGMAFAAFGGGSSELGSHFIPLSLQAYADACTVSARERAAAAANGNAYPKSDPASAWFPGLGHVRPDSAYHTSALLAAGWDTFLAPLRRSSRMDPDAELLGCSSAEGESRPDRAVHVGGGTGMRGVTEDGDARTRHGGRGVGASEWYDPALELEPRQPVVGLRGDVTLGDVLASLSPSPAHRLATLALGFPFPHPRASATRLHRMLMHPPYSGNGSGGKGGYRLDHGIHTAGLDLLAPLSWTSALPSRYYSAPSTAAAGSPAAAAEARVAQKLRPLAHMLVARGVGSHSITGGKYTSGLDAYGRVLDDVMERAGVRQACHAAFRTPLPLPLSFPAALFAAPPEGSGNFPGLARPTPRYDEAGGLLEDEDQGRYAGQPSQPGSNGGGGDGGLPLPFCVPVLAYAAAGPTYAPALRRLHSDFSTRDASVLHRFSSVARIGSGVSGGGGGQEDLSEVENVLAQLLDDYAPTSEM